MISSHDSCGTEDTSIGDASAARIEKVFQGGKRWQPEVYFHQGLVHLRPLTLLLLGGFISWHLSRGRCRNLAYPTMGSQHEIERLYYRPSDAYCRAVEKPIVCAHGGDVISAFPNTLKAYRSALDKGATCLEIDVSITRDGHLVALHDRDIQSLINFTKERNITIPWYTENENHHFCVSHYFLSELRILRWKDGSKVMLFQSVVELAAQNSVEIIADLKPPPAASILQASKDLIQLFLGSVATDIQRQGHSNKTIVWSKNDDILLQLSQIDSKMRLGVIVVNETEEDFQAQRWKVERLEDIVSAAGVHHALATSAIVEEAWKKLRRRVIVWTAEKAHMMSQALDAAPWGIVTGNVEFLIDAMRRRNIACTSRPLDPHREEL